MGERKLPAGAGRGAVDAFLARLAATPAVRPAGTRARLVFAMDATASREPTWDRACRIQGDMFTETAALGGVAVQLVWYRGYGEFEASPWCDRPELLAARMTEVRCRAGQTQIERVLRHVAAEARRGPVRALVFVGDCTEEEPAALYRVAGELGVLGVPAFLFHEGDEPLAAATFREIARLTGGVCLPFDGASARELRDLLAAVAVYAAGGRQALEAFGRRRGAVVGRVLVALPRPRG